MVVIDAAKDVIEKSRTNLLSLIVRCIKSSVFAEENNKYHDDGENTSSCDHDCNWAGGRKPPELHEEDGETD